MRTRRPDTVAGRVGCAILSVDVGCGFQLIQSQEVGRSMRLWCRRLMVVWRKEGPVVHGLIPHKLLSSLSCGM